MPISMNRRINVKVLEYSLNRPLGSILGYGILGIIVFIHTGNSITPSMKTAIICDWLVTVGGAEKCLAELLLCYPDADVFAVVDFLEPGQRGFLLNKPVR